MTSKIWMACAGTVVLLASVGTSGCGQSSSGSPPVEGLGGFPVLDAGVDDGGGAEQRHSDGAASDGSAAEAGPNNGTMRFTLANPVGTTLTNTAIEMPVTDSSCMGSGAKSQCSVTGSVTSLLREEPESLVRRPAGAKRRFRAPPESSCPAGHRRRHLYGDMWHGPKIVDRVVRHAHLVQDQATQGGLLHGDHVHRGHRRTDDPFARYAWRRHGEHRLRRCRERRPLRRIVMARQR